MWEDWCGTFRIVFFKPGSELKLLDFGGNSS